MSQLEHAVSPEVQLIMEQHSAFKKVFPHLYGLMVTRSNDFNGISIFLGHSGDWLCMVKRFGEDGSPEVMFCAGQTPFDALTTANRAVQGGKWRPDTRKK